MIPYYTMGIPLEFWKRVKYFTASENWGDVDKISLELILELDAYREKINTPILITCGTQGKHVTDSAHYRGLAVDLVFPEKRLSDLPDLFLTVLRFSFNGIGLYTDWKYKDRVIGGMHLDIRPTPKKATWIGTNGAYIAADFSNLYHLFKKENAQV